MRLCHYMLATNGLIQPPPRSGPFGVAIIIIDVFLLTISSFQLTISAWTAITSLALIAAALFVRNFQSLHLSIFTGSLIVAPYLNPSLRSWPFFLLIPVLCYGIIVLMVPGLRTSALWIRRGAPDKTAIIATSIISITAGISLVLWYVILKPDVTVQLHKVPDMPLWLYPVAGIAFAAGNAAVEEFAYRGIIMQALDSAAGPGVISLFVQACSFGAMHYLQGFPKGVGGAAMATAYGSCSAGCDNAAVVCLLPG
jgi:Type II CAAX prenyl endopeptidase Rce1-like